MTFIVLGSAIAGILVFIAVLGSIAYFKFNNLIEEPYQIVDSPPEISDKPKFLGTSGAYNGEFDSQTNKVLSGGSSTLYGYIKSNSEPVEGLDIRLALNEKVYSLWAKTDSMGKYTINVPPGKYKVYGYELKYKNAHNILPGKIENPYNSISTYIFEVKNGQSAKAIDLNYVDPVSNIEPKGTFSQSKNKMISWSPYPGAASYRLQIVEQKVPTDFSKHKRLFEWNERPVLTEPFVNVSERSDIVLKKGYFYKIEITALDKDERMLSRTARMYNDPDFFVTD